MTQFLNRISTRTKLSVAALALLLAGGAIGAGIARHAGPVPAMAPAAPRPIAEALAVQPPLFGPRPITTVRGTVSAVFGSSFTLKDASGQMLVEWGGARGNTLTLVAAGQNVTVQGMARDGVIRARYLVTADGQAWAVGRGGHHRGGERDERQERGAGRDSAAPVPASAPAPVPVTTPPAR